MVWPRWGALQVEPVFCANCGKLHGYVPSENTTFACWLCNECAEKYGTSLAGYLMPDEVYWERVRQETSGLTFSRVQALAESAWGSLSKLIREQPKGRI
jgi:hypothetical protein